MLDDPVVLAGRLDGDAALVRVVAAGLLDVHVLAGLQRGLDQGVVRGRGSGDHEGVEVPVLQEVLEPGGGSGPRQEPPHLVELPLIEIADVRERTVGDLKVVAGQVLAPAADAGHRDLDHPLIHGCPLREKGLAPVQTARTKATIASRIRSAAWPSPKEAATAAEKSVRPAGARASQVDTAARITSGSTPARMLPPPCTVSIHSVSSRSVMQGQPRKNASF